ncbi:crossover junction endodeoxyribonuclease RuvC [Thermosulfurimonas marina]|uniref:Crossover junction endodeoxyribonuclease RuvC n=1 Tax=Thermosulfurimonas marina TaxID=2047767 RepID=A0A6H1WSD8_9BACT|nr:crossover junction endodeoxyribonuclease RuvC [Thermosulfurimonas marina]QJA06088.1 crossover junction endodeoxyribonuclease RuvC [Thermosulfurimonas marina]
MRILGIDPGCRATGYGLIEAQSRSPRALAWGVIRPRAGDPLPERLAFLFQKLEDLILTLAPQVLALEEVIPERFPRAALSLGQAQGVVLVLAARHGLPVRTYHPSAVKLALTGNGRARKEEVAFMVRATLGLAESLPRDASDALALALTHLYGETRCWPRSAGV